VDAGDRSGHGETPDGSAVQTFDEKSLSDAAGLQATALSEGADEASRALEEAGELLREAIHSKRWKDPTVLSAARKSRQRLQRAAKDLSSGALRSSPSYSRP